MSESQETIYSALLKARAKFATPEKNASNDHFKSKYATLDAVFKAAMGPLNENGIVVFQPISGNETGYFVKTILWHTPSGSSIETEVPMLMGKQDMQGFKSASTYARRIGFENLTGLAPSDEDDDAETVRESNPMGAGLNDAWKDSVMDRLKPNATPREIAEAFADAIIEDFKDKGERALQNRWNKHKRMVEEMERRHPDLHEKIVDAYENCIIDLEDAKRNKAAAG